MARSGNAPATAGAAQIPPGECKASPIRGMAAPTAAKQITAAIATIHFIPPP